MNVGSGRHQGQVARVYIKRCGRTFSSVAAAMELSRSTLYARLKQPRLAPSFLFRLGYCIGHDFLKDFPALKSDPHYLKVREEVACYGGYGKQLARIRTKYERLLRNYHQLPSSLLKVISRDLIQLQKDVEALLAAQRGEAGVLSEEP